jgi:hypothetical protein
VINLKSFNLKAALNGEPVMLRNGKKKHSCDTMRLNFQWWMNTAYLASYAMAVKTME